MIAIAYAVAVLLPLLFLYLIYSQDLYGQGKFRYVVFAFLWGLAAFGGAYVVNGFLKESFLVGVLDMDPQEASRWLPVLVAPIVEELLKSLAVIGLGRKMTYFVDGAIYGFAAGTAFSILENVLYLGQPTTRSAGLVALVRTFSTCLMHGAASALVGTAVGRLRYGRGAKRLVSPLLGWLLAIILHVGFNAVVYFGARWGGLWIPIAGAFGIGIGGAALIIVFIRGGLKEEKRWMEETLHMGVRVTKKEADLVQKYDQVDELLLQPIVERFGQEKADQVELFLLKQAQFGIKRKARMMSQNPREQEQLDVEADKLHTEMEDLRKRVGVFCMSYVRTVFPEEVLEGMASRLASRVKMEGLPEDGGGLLHAGVTAKLEQTEHKAAGISMWGRLGGEEDKPAE